MSGRKDFEQWAREVGVRLVPMIRESSAVVNIVPIDPTELDILFALEVGLAILMDKPIIAVVPPGRAVPAKLLAVADRIVEGDVTSSDFAGRLHAADRRGDDVKRRQPIRWTERAKYLATIVSTLFSGLLVCVFFSLLATKQGGA